MSMSPSHALHQQLTERVRDLQQALDGFPVLDLVQSYADEAASNSFLLTHACLSNWQAALDEAIVAHEPGSDDAHQRLHARQQRARDAIANVRSLLISVECQRAKTAD